MEKSKQTLILGASHKPERYSYKAAKKLTDNGYPIVQVSNRKNENPFGPIQDKTFWEGEHDIDTVTLYIGPQHQPDYYDKIIQLKPRRVIFNPGTENPDFILKLDEKGIESEVACTLVLLGTNQY